MGLKISKFEVFSYGAIMAYEIARPKGESGGTNWVGWTLFLGGIAALFAWVL